MLAPINITTQTLPGTVGQPIFRLPIVNQTAVGGGGVLALHDASCPGVASQMGEKAGPIARQRSILSIGIAAVAH